jgi:hypothetical protein
MATNYPLVRLTQRHARAPVVYYCRTHDHSTMGISRARRRPHAHSFFDVPSHVMPGAYKLEVVVNGIPSEPLHVSVT